MAEAWWRELLSEAGLEHEGPGDPPTALIVEAAARQLEPMGFEIVVVPGAEALERLAALRAENPQKSPFMIGALAGLADHIEALQESDGDRAPEEILRAADALDLDAWISEARARRVEIAALSPDTYPPRGPWPEEDGAEIGPIIHLRLSPGVHEFLEEGFLESELEAPTPTFTPLEAVAILLAPTPDPTEIAAWLRFGGWNECPEPEVHIALARRWRDRFGARLISNGRDLIEFEVARPPTTRADALALADIHHLYCSDAIDQGAQTLEALAADRLNAPYWGFWWD